MIISIDVRNTILRYEDFAVDFLRKIVYCICVS